MALDIFKSYNKKLATQLQAEANVAARRQDEADAIAEKQLSDIRKTIPVEMPPELKAALPPKATGGNPSASNYVPLIAGGLAVAFGLAMLIGSRR